MLSPCAILGQFVFLLYLEHMKSMLKETHDVQQKQWDSKKIGGMFGHLEQRFQKPTTKANSERASLLEPFIKRLQSNTGKYKPMTKAYICSKMAYIETGDLYAFYQKLHESPNFGGIWNWYCVAKDLNKK